METPIKIKTVKFYFKTRNEPKNAEIYRKKKTKNNELFLKTENGPKVCRNGSKKGNGTDN